MTIIRHIKIASVSQQNTGDLYSAMWQLFSDEQYVQLAKKQWFELFRLEEPLAALIEGASVLEVGCGGGTGIYNLLKADAKKVTAIDLSYEALEHSRHIVDKFFPDRKGQIELHQADALELPFEDAQFDFIYSNGVLHHTPDPKRAFSELVRCLKPNGSLWVGLYGSGGLMTKVLIPIGRLAGKIIPRKATQTVLNIFLKNNPLAIYRVLDPMYVPYRFDYRTDEIIKWFDEYGIIEPVRTFRCADSFYKFGPWMSGEGWVGFRGRKREN